MLIQPQLKRVWCAYPAFELPKQKDEVVDFPVFDVLITEKHFFLDIELRIRRYTIRCLKRKYVESSGYL
jgi:hypothetical protein